MATRTIPEIPEPTEVKQQILSVLQDEVGTYQPSGRLAYSIGNPPDGQTVTGGVEVIQQIVSRIAMTGGSDVNCWNLETDIILIAHQRQLSRR